MRGRHAVLLFLFLGPPSLATAEFEIPAHRWTIGYESNGVTLRRFLGESWEVYLGGGPNDYRSALDSQEFRYSEVDTVAPYRLDLVSRKSESGHVRLGVGCGILREERFWLTAILDVKYSWDNFQERWEYQYFSTSRQVLSEDVGHAMITRVSFGLRPAFDITPRVVLMMEFGFYYQNVTRTTDSRRTEIDSNGNWYEDTEREVQNSDAVGVFGYNSLSSISLLFRF